MPKITKETLLKIANGRPIGVDVSFCNTSRDSYYKAMKDDLNVQFCFVKYSEGTSIDSLFQKHMDGLSKVGITKGIYSVLRGSISAEKQAETILNCKTFGEMPIALDVELPHPKLWSNSIVVAEILKKAGKRVLIYSANGYIAACKPNELEYVKHSDLWMAQYFSNPNIKEPDMSKVKIDKRDWLFWQACGSDIPGIQAYYIDGINTDINFFNGTDSMLKTYLGI